MVADNIDIYEVSMDGRLINVMVSPFTVLTIVIVRVFYLPFLSVFYILIFLYTEVLISHLTSTFFNFLSSRSDHSSQTCSASPKKSLSRFL